MEKHAEDCVFLLHSTLGQRVHMPSPFLSRSTLLLLSFLAWSFERLNASQISQGPPLHSGGTVQVLIRMLSFPLRHGTSFDYRVSGQDGGPCMAKDPGRIDELKVSEALLLCQAAHTRTMY